MMDNGPKCPRCKHPGLSPAMLEGGDMVRRCDACGCACRDQQMILRDILPNFRTSRGMVEIPASYDAMVFVMNKTLSNIVNLAVRETCSNYGRVADISDEHSDDAGATRKGWIVPVEDFDRMAVRKLDGWKWLEIV